MPADALNPDRQAAVHKERAADCKAGRRHYYIQGRCWYCERDERDPEETRSLRTLRDLFSYWTATEANKIRELLFAHMDEQAAEIERLKDDRQRVATEHCPRCGQLHAAGMGPGPHCVDARGTEPPTAYHRKLAEAICKGCYGYTNEEYVDRIAAALADEGVVDPEGMAEIHLRDERIKDLERQLAALREKDKARDATYELLSKACSSYKQQLAALRGDSDA